MNYKGIKDKIHLCLNCSKPVPFKSYSSNFHKYCNSQCCGEHRSRLVHERNVKLFQQGKLKNRMKIYELLVERDGNKCSCCGITEWNGKPIRFWVDHINGTANDNMPNNFRLICPNCDSQSPTFANRNKGRGRRSLGLTPYG